MLTEQGALLEGLDSNDRPRDGALDSLTKVGGHLEAAEPALQPSDG